MLYRRGNAVSHTEPCLLDQIKIYCMLGHRFTTVYRYRHQYGMGAVRTNLSGTSEIIFRGQSQTRSW
jgi:hypothetical protein